MYPYYHDYYRPYGYYGCLCPYPSYYHGYGFDYYRYRCPYPYYRRPWW